MFRWREKNKVCADVIPYFYNGKYHIFFLNANDENSGWSRSQTPWSHLVSKDLINFEKLPDAIIPGDYNSDDGHACFTGSVIVRDYVWHIFYTGFSPLNKTGREKIMHAISKNGINFVKDERPLINLDFQYYGADEDFRDPNVMYYEDEDTYIMTITTGDKNPISNCQRGVIGLAKSKDLVEWEVCPPIHTPESYMPMECTDLFKMGDKWYIIFSQYGFTEYRMAHSIYGPWVRPQNPILDGGSSYFYAAKTLFDGKRRIIMGWAGTNEMNIDRTSGQWGGDIVSPREIYRNSRGELSVRPIAESFVPYKNVTLKKNIILGDWKINQNIIENEFKSGFSILEIHESENPKIIKASIKFKKGYGNAGIMLNCSKDISTYYYCNVDNGLNELSIIRNGYRQTVYGAIFDGVRKMASQKIALECDVYNITIFLKDNIIEVFLNDEITVTARICDFTEGLTCIVANDVKAEFEIEIFE